MQHDKTKTKLFLLPVLIKKLINSLLQTMYQNFAEERGSNLCLAPNWDGILKNTFWSQYIYHAIALNQTFNMLYLSLMVMFVLRF